MTTSKLLAMEAVKSSRAQKAAATRQRMLDAAYELFCELGFRATTMSCHVASFHEVPASFGRRAISA